VSVPNERTRATGVPSTSAGRVTADGKRVFRMTPPVVIWWSWVGLLAFAVGDLVIQEHRFVSLRFAFGALALTGVVYALTLWPKVIADDVGIEVRNPIRVFRIPWPAVRGIFLADSVEVQCARQAPKKDKTVYSWALSSPRRARARAQLRAWQWDQGKRNRPSGYRQLPETAQSLVKMTTAEIMARELATMSDEARFKSVVQDVDLDVDANKVDSDGPADGATSDTTDLGKDDAFSDRSAGPTPASQPAEPDAAYFVSSTWAWFPILAVVLPTTGFVLTTLVK
jgi:hypothetical protein